MTAMPCRSVADWGVDLYQHRRRLSSDKLGGKRAADYDNLKPALPPRVEVVFTPRAAWGSASESDFYRIPGCPFLAATAHI